MKTCNKCGDLLPLLAFGKDNRNKDNLKHTCRMCRKGLRLHRLRENFNPVTERVCTLCNRLLPANKFHKNSGKVSGIESSCKECRNNKIIEKRYGLAAGELKQMKIKADYKCAICGEEVSLHVDHCHSTGVIRGLLCNSCNTGLGHFKDNPTLLYNAISYLGKVLRRVKDEF